MSNRNWGLPPKGGQLAFRDAKTAKPLLTLFISAVFGVIGAAVAVISFAEARDTLSDLFHGLSLAGAIVAAGFGCWTYIWIARPRFAAQFTTRGDAFSKLLRFYARAMVALAAMLGLALLLSGIEPKIISVLLLCASGGAGAAAAFQTVLAFVPYYEEDANGAKKS
ncbi:hypothetical protein [Hyphococcus lacteus]|uniref:Uncharacterized protein n=1 Tax=Hyphococcus lacteus TaxID=3143536 RepID=A0ABV3Z6P0_9PROT